VASRQPYGRQFIDLAECGSNGWRSYAAVLARIVLYPLAFGVVVGASALALGAVRPASASGAAASAVAIIVQFGSVIVCGIALIRGVTRSHRRPWLTLVTTERRLDWRRIAIGAGAQAAIAAAQLALVHLATGWPWRFAVPDAWPLALLMLLLIPWQAASEEILFRGYLTQTLGRLVRSRTAIAVGVGLLFGALHLNVYGPLTVPYFFILSLVFSAVSLRDNRLELAVGGHAAMNFLAIASAGFAPLAPAVVAAGGPVMPFNGAAIAVLIVDGAMFYGLTRLMVDRFCRA
jgi:membrane protease YdiL (CAAX protease family)